MRFFKRGPVEVIRKLYDIRDTLPTDVDIQLTASAEVRALRPWEEFDEGIIRWQLRAFVAAAGALFGGIQIAINGSGPNFTTADAVPRGSLLIIDEIKNAAANAIRLYIGANSTGLISSTPADYTDARWGPRTAIPPVLAVSGTNGAISGDEINYVGAGERWQKAGLFVAITQQAATPLSGDQTLTIFTNAVNQDLDSRISGRIVLPR